MAKPNGNGIIAMPGNQKWFGEAPSNIALIKYMGKSNAQKNEASNSSISYTLDYLKSEVCIKLNPEGIRDEWKPWDSQIELNVQANNELDKNNNSKNQIQLSQAGIEKFLKHWQRCRERLAPNFKGAFCIYSRNHFPSDCGLASSASSFAALTRAAENTFAGLGVITKNISTSELAILSREGSGSSCRSFFSPFVLWKGNDVLPVESQFQNLSHIVVIVSDAKKKVSSSEAHKRVASSLLYQERAERADLRTQEVIKALQTSDWKSLFELTWADFWDMHVLFETSMPPFSYMLPESLKVLRWVQNIWEQENDGPLVTMDAGANVHLLYRENQKKLALEHKNTLTSNYSIFTDL